VKLTYGLKCGVTVSKGIKVSADEFEVKTGDEIESLCEAFGRMRASVEFAKMVLGEKPEKPEEMPSKK